MSAEKQSTCWRCGKDVAEGQVECDGGCGNPPSDSKERIICFQITAIPDPDKIKSKSDARAFNIAARKFGRSLNKIFIESGLNYFCKPVKP